MKKTVRDRKFPEIKNKNYQKYRHLARDKKRYVGYLPKIKLNKYSPNILSLEINLKENTKMR